MTFIPRDIMPTLQRALQAMPVVVLSGMRQTGKTTLLQCAEFRHRLFFSLDQFAELAAAKQSPDNYIARDQPITVDEVQRAPELLVAIKRAVDQDRTPGRFLLSGSANLALHHRVNESLAGRAVYLYLAPMNRRELSTSTATEPYVKRLFEAAQPPEADPPPPIRPDEVLAGGMPSVVLGTPDTRTFWFDGFERTYLERDLREFSRLADLLPFRTFLHLAALRTAGMLNIADIGRDAKLTRQTASNYLDLLELSFLVWRNPPYRASRATRLVKTPKLYTSDAGLAAYLTGIEETSDPLFGALAETYVAHNLRSILDARWREARLHYWHIQGRHEVDFVIEARRSVMAMEFKMAERFHSKDFDGLRAFLAHTPHARFGVLAYNGRSAVPFGDRLFAVPIAMLLS